MAQTKMAKLPSVLRDPIKMQLVTSFMRNALEAERKKAVDEGKIQNFRPTDNLIKSAIAEIERLADAKLGDHLDGI
jgi:hypothetical protein